MSARAWTDTVNAKRVPLMNVQPNIRMQLMVAFGARS